MVTTFYPPYHFGGDGTYVRALSEALVKLGHDVTVVHCEDAYRLASKQPHVDTASTTVTIHRLRSRWGMLSPLLTQQTGYPMLKKAALAEILAQEFDVVHFHNLSLIGGPGLLALSKAKVNLYTLHEHWLICPTHILWKDRAKACDQRQCVRCCMKSGIPPQWWRYTSLIENSLKYIDCILSPSQFTAQQHIEQGIDRPIKVLPLFSYLSPAEYSDQPQTQRGFITVGRITASKGVAELVRAFAQWPDLQLQVVGDGDLLPSLKQRYGEAKNIQFLGQVSQSSLQQLYQGATALILPSLAPETFGLTVVEAFACGTPAIVRIAGGNREAIDQSGAGFLYEDDQQLRAVIDQFENEPSLRSVLGAKARAAYEQLYTEQRHVDDYLTTVDELLKCSRVGVR